MYRYYIKNQLNYDYNYPQQFPQKLNLRNYRKNNMDYGNEPYVTDIEKDTLSNPYFRKAIWTGKHLQVTLMSIDVNSDIGLEIHPEIDQFLRIEQGEGMMYMGESKDKLSFKQYVTDGSAIFIPAGTWHNLVNTGDIPIKLYSVYSPPQHPKGTIHKTKKDAQESSDDYRH